MSNKGMHPTRLSEVLIREEARGRVMPSVRFLPPSARVRLVKTMMRFITLSVIYALSVTNTLAQTTARYHEQATPSGKGGIRRANFLNAVYDAGCAGQKVRVRNGQHSPQGSGFFFQVAVSYGDLTGDGTEEAVVVTQCFGAVQNLSEAKVYAWRMGRAVEIARLEEGTKNDGDILSARIRKGRLIVKRGPSERRCVEEGGVAEETTRYRWQGHRMVAIGRPVCTPLKAP